MTTIEVSNNWPLMVVPLFRDSSFQRKSIPSAAHPQELDNPKILDSGMGPETAIFSEKGMFIDIYV